MEDNEEVYEPDPDEAYDRMRDDFLMCNTDEEAIELYKRYGWTLCNKYLANWYEQAVWKYRIKELDDKINSLTEWNGYAERLQADYDKLIIAYNDKFPVEPTK